MGASAVIFSGGKEIGGPQTSGILLGKTDLISAARLNGCPNEQSVGRPMKCSKEDIVGLVSALRQFCERPAGDEDIGEQYDQRIQALIDGLGPEVQVLCRCRRVCPGPPDIQPNIIPRLYVDVLQHPTAFAHVQSKHSGGLEADIYGDSLDHGNPLAITPTNAATALAAKLASSSPRIAVNTTSNGIMINPQTVTIEEASLIAKRVSKALKDLADDNTIQRFRDSKL